MDIELLRHYRADLDRRLSKKRFEHTLGVAYSAAALAMLYGEDIEKALIAGLLHDCAKCLSADEQIAIMKDAGEEPDDELLSCPKVLHAKAGAILARERYHISDSDIISSISYHTTARAHMSTLEKIIFIADYIEPIREDFKGLNDIRKLAFHDLDECLYRALSDTIERLDERGLRIYHDTLDAFNWYAAERLLQRSTYGQEG